MSATSSIFKYHYSQMLLIFLILLHISLPIFAARIIDDSPAESPDVGMVYTPPYNPYRWSGDLPMTLKYAFLQDNPVAYLSRNDIESAFASAFATWSSVIPVTFEKTDDLTLSDITIGFFRGDHGDGVPFDGMNGALAHTFSPPSGIMHFDADERWVVDFNKDKSKHAFDLLSIATHEIGHLLGLGHTNFEGAIMYPSIHAREKRVDLTVDDVYRVQGLYGPDPNFNPYASHVPSSGCGDLEESRNSFGFVILLASVIIMIL